MSGQPISSKSLLKLTDQIDSVSLFIALQRFGSTEISTHSIGLALLKRDWKEAIELILKPRPNDRMDMEECRAIWTETRDPAKALEKLARRKCPER